MFKHVCFLALCFTAYPQVKQAVVEKANEQVNRNSTQDLSPQQIIGAKRSVDNGNVVFITNIMFPPDKFTFKAFGNVLQFQGRYVDYPKSPTNGLIEIYDKKDTTTEVQVKFTLPTNDDKHSADDFDKWMEGNLNPPAGGKGKGKTPVFAWSGRLSSGKFDIDTDIDRDGQVDNDKDEPNEEEVGTIVISDQKVRVFELDKKSDTGFKELDKVSVYELKNEPARRRKIILRREDGDMVNVRRSGPNIQLYENEKPTKDEKPIFDKGVNLVRLDKTKSYWLHGVNHITDGDGVRKEHLAVLDDNEKLEDQINITVIWADITARAKATEKIPPVPVFDKPNDFFKLVKNSKASEKGLLGIREYLINNEPVVRGLISIESAVFPNDMREDSFDEKLTNDEERIAINGEGFAQAKFGFIYRRSFYNVEYKNFSGDKANKVEQYRSGDDSDPDFAVDVDLDPVAKNEENLVVDLDAPSVAVEAVGPYFLQLYQNFIQHLNFQFSGQPERMSDTLPWAWSIAIGLSNPQALKSRIIDGSVSDYVYLFDEPNNNKSEGLNNVHVGKHISQKRRVNKISITSVNGGNKVIKTKMLAPNRRFVFFEVDGKNLSGEPFLINGNQKITNIKSMSVLKLDKNNQVISALVRFNLPSGLKFPSTGWTFKLSQNENNNPNEDSVTGITFEK